VNKSNFSSSKVAMLLVVTFNPTDGFEDHLEKLFGEFENIIIVDNGSLLPFQLLLATQAKRWGEALQLLLNSKNLGIATALNQGFQLAIQMGYELIVTLDQDSLPVTGMLNNILRTYWAQTYQDRIAVVAPVVENLDVGILARYLRPKGRIFFERKDCTGVQTLHNVSVVITSGALHSLRVYEKLGPFRDEFFIDYVDTEYCLRAKRNGFDIIVACDAHVNHKLGNQKKISVGSLEMRPTFHSPIRWYYISRNRILTVGKYGFRFPHWIMYEIVIVSYGLFKMLLLEDYKWKKILSFFFGTLDGLMGRSGEIPEKRRKLLVTND
jgi:rhamnosyltransferase